LERFKIDGHDMKNMLINAANSLQENKQYVNSLNVFPVPDGDTGTNMSMTFKSAVSEIENINDRRISEVARRISKGALMGARGNSGVILSQIFRGISKGLEGKDDADAIALAQSIQEGAKFAYKAVMRPTEGTILTIIKAAGDSAINSNESDIVQLLEKVCEHSEKVLNKTPDMLPALKEAKVVDAGGMGLLIILKGMYNALKENIKPMLKEEIQKVETSISNNSAQINVSTEDIEFGYCTEFFIKTSEVLSKVQHLKETLCLAGDSMIVVGEEDIIKVHIHTNDPGMVLSEAIKLGELSKIKIDNMREQHSEILELEYASTKVENDIKEIYIEQTDNEEKKYAFITVSMGNGLNNIFEDLGVDAVIEGGQTMNPSTQDILEQIHKVNAENIFVLPNNKNIIMAAEQAAGLSEKNVIVIPTKTIPQGITAITAFSTDDALDINIEQMKESISNVSTGFVTYAVRDTEMEGKIIKEGNILGLVESKIFEVGKDIYEVCNGIIDKMMEKESELITIFYGKDCDADKVDDFISRLEIKYPDSDIQYYSGDQPLYYFIVSVE